MSNDEEKMQKLLADGWVLVDTKPAEGQIVDTIYWWTDGRLLPGSGIYRNGQYWGRDCMLDTPSFWRAMP
jgi:hypothetical protein